MNRRNPPFFEEWRGPCEQRSLYGPCTFAQSPFARVAIRCACRAQIGNETRPAPSSCCRLFDTGSSHKAAHPMLRLGPHSAPLTKLAHEMTVTESFMAEPRWGHAEVFQKRPIGRVAWRGRG